MSTTHPNPKRASDRNAHANNPTPRTPRTTSEPAPARPKFSRLCRGPACWAPAPPDVRPYLAISLVSVPLATNHGAKRSLAPMHADAITSLLSPAESTLPQNTPRNPRRMNTCAKTAIGGVTSPTSVPRTPSDFAMGRPMNGQSDASNGWPPRRLVLFFLLLRLSLEWAGGCNSFGGCRLRRGFACEARGFGASPEGVMGGMVAAVGCPTMDHAGIGRATIGRGHEEAFLAYVVPVAARLQRLAMRYAGSRADAEDICQESMLKAYLKMGQFVGHDGQVGALEYEFHAWLRKITANSAIDYLRRKQAKRFVSWEETVHGRLGSDGSSSGKSSGTSSGASRGSSRELGSRETYRLTGGMPDGASGALRNGLSNDAPLGSSLGNTSAWAENPERAYLRKERRRQMARAIAKLPVELRRVCLLRNVLQYTTKEVAARLGISTTAVRVRLFRAQARLRERMPQA